MRKISQSSFSADYTYTLTSVGNSTRMTLVAEFSVDGIVRLPWPLLKIAARMSDAGQLDALKAAVESRTQSPSSG